MTPFARQRIENTRRALAGDPVAFGEILREHDADLRAMVWTIIGSRIDLDDVMQLSYERAFRSIASFEGRSSIKTWLHAICRRVAIDQLRYEGRRRHEGSDAMERLASSSSPATTVMAQIELEETFALLDESQRTALVLTACLGYTNADAAEIMNIPEGTIASKVHRARNKLVHARTKLATDSQ